MEQKFRIQELQDKKNISNVQLADKVGVSEVMISYYRFGKRTPPLSSMIKLAAALEVHFMELFEAPEGFHHVYDEVSGNWDGLRRNVDIALSPF